jgi:putative ABC transport system substrate-binding protein
MKRREFITLLGGGAAAWPLTVRAQQGEKVRRIGNLMNLAANDPHAHARNAAFEQALQQLGWIIGRNVHIDLRWGEGDADRVRRHAAELVALRPDVILCSGGTTTAPLQQVTRSVPIVFVNATDPVGAGFVASLARPGGNITGFSGMEYGMSGKWLELLKEIAPHLNRVAVLRDSAAPGQIAQLAAIQAVAPSLRVDWNPIGLRDAREIERDLKAFADGSNAGMIVTASLSALVHRDLIIKQAAQNRLPAMYSDNTFVIAGGLISYGPDRIDPYRRAAGYVDRILKGEKPADLPVQAPTKYELVINLKTAKALGLTVPPTLLARADEVIE